MTPDEHTLFLWRLRQEGRTRKNGFRRPRAVGVVSAPLPRISLLPHVDVRLFPIPRLTCYGCGVVRSFWPGFDPLAHYLEYDNRFCQTALKAFEGEHDHGWSRRDAEFELELARSA